jgi:hypothetical protein
MRIFWGKGVVACYVAPAVFSLEAGSLPVTNLYHSIIVIAQRRVKNVRCFDVINLVHPI